MFKRVLEVRTRRFCGCELGQSNESGITWISLDQLSLLGESASPFIDEGDGLTSERERVRMLLSLVAHAGRYRMMVGAHNTVEGQMHMGGGVFSLGMADVGACHTVDT